MICTPAGKPRLNFARDLGKWIRRRRDLHGFTQEQLGAAIDGVHRNIVCRWETGQQLPDAFQMHLLRELFNKEAR